MRASAHLKPMKQSKPFYGFEIIQMHDQNAYWGFGVILTTLAK